MKLKFSGILISLAGFQSISAEEVPNGPGLRYYAKVQSILEQRLEEYFTTETGKKVGGKLRIFKYGCYCFPGNKAEYGNVAMNNPRPRNGYTGPPLDELDALCYKLFKSEQCLEQKWQADPVTAPYCNFTHTASFNYKYSIDENKNTVCGIGHFTNRKKQNYLANNANTMSCKLDSCNLEDEFLNSFIDLVENQGFLDRFNRQHNMIHDDEYDSLCVNPSRNNVGGPKQFDECCGVGLNRRFYNGAIHSCCNEKVVPFGTC